MNFKRDESEQKLRGGYYTPPDVARFLARWVMAPRPGRVLEPSCGDGAFLAALGDESPGGATEVLACELSAAEASAARSRLRRLDAEADGLRGEVIATEFLGWSLAHPEERVDGVVGNPPFIRYQYLEPEVQARASELYARHGLRFTKHTNAWVPFVIASLAHLEPGGRLGMVVPAELLHVLHAGAAREFLLRTCARIAVIDPEALWFEQALQGVVLLLAERAGPQPAIDAAPGVAILRTRDRSFLDTDPDAALEKACFVRAEELGHKWMRALLSDRERGLVARIGDHARVFPFAEIADVEVGIVTGANAFFLVSDATLEKFDLAPWAEPMFGRSEHVRGFVHRDADQRANRERGLSVHFLRFGSVPLDELPEGPRAYLALGEEQELHRRYKCRIREPWYDVPSVWASPVSMLKRSHHFSRLILNEANALTTDTAYRIRPRHVSAAVLVASFPNVFTALEAELEGRHYGGGVLELVPSEIARLRIPVLVDTEASLSELDAAMRGGAEPAAILMHHADAMSEALDLEAGDCDELLAAWDRLRRRRQRC